MHIMCKHGIQYFPFKLQNRTEQFICTSETIRRCFLPYCCFELWLLSTVSLPYSWNTTYTMVECVVTPEKTHLKYLVVLSFGITVQMEEFLKWNIFLLSFFSSPCQFLRSYFIKSLVKAESNFTFHFRTSEPNVYFGPIIPKVNFTRIYTKKGEPDEKRVELGQSISRLLVSRLR